MVNDQSVIHNSESIISGKTKQEIILENIQNTFNDKFGADNIELPIKNGECEYIIYNADGSQFIVNSEAKPGGLEYQAVLTLFKKSVSADVALR